MRFIRIQLRRLLAPLLLVIVAVAVTVPWTFWVIAAAYDRDIVDNVKALARRIQLQYQLTIASGLPPAPAQSFEQLEGAFKTELLSERSVQLVVFCNITRYPRASTFTYPRSNDVSVPAWTGDEILQKSVAGVTRSQDEGIYNLGMWFVRYLLSRPQPKGEEHYTVTVPWEANGRSLGFTYVELDRNVLRYEFWKKEGPLLKNVMEWTATGILVTSSVGIFAFRSWRNAGRVRERAELARQGLLAERGLTAAVLAHEIRNPLAALRFQLHSIRRNAAELPKVGATCDLVDEELLRIQRLVQDYLDHEKAATLRTNAVELNEAVHTLRGILDELLVSRDTRLAIESAEPRVVVACDPHALRQVLMNLVLNAQQAMGRGGTITIGISRSEDAGVLSVTDTGPGIPPEMRDRLFKPFQTSKKEGSGIGLALVKRFVENFAGSVEVESEVGHGATFRLRLPLAQPPAPGAVSGPGSEQGTSGAEEPLHLPAGR